MFTTFIATSVTLATLSTASSLPPPIIRAPIAAHNGDAVATGWGKWRAKRQDAVGIRNQQLGTAYTVDLEIGTPPQNVTVMVDTGSANLWVNPECDSSGQESYCEEFAQFDYTKSSTITDTGVQEDLSYGKGEVIIEYVTDKVTFGSATIEDQIFGIGLESTELPIGILGLSPPVDGVEEYSYVLDSMVTQNLIASRAFTLDLRDTDSPDGALIFGGIDTGKFIGSLEKCPILDPSETPSGADRYWISLSYIGMTNSDGESGTIVSGDGLAVFLDSGGTVTRLPTEIFTAIGDAFAGLGAQYDTSSGFYMIDCDVMQQGGSLDFGFGEKVISVSYENFIWRYPDTNTCLLGVLEDNDEPVMGDSFLRAAYVVYDQDNDNIHLAQAANCGSNLVEIDSGSDAVPSVTGDCSASFTATMASSTLDFASGGAPTITADAGSFTSVVGPGPEGTGTATSSGNLCLTCTSTKTKGTATESADGARQTKGAAPGRESGSLGAVVGAVAVVAWIV